MRLRQSIASILCYYNVCVHASHSTIHTNNVVVQRARKLYTTIPFHESPIEHTNPNRSQTWCHPHTMAKRTFSPSTLYATTKAEGSNAERVRMRNSRAIFSCPGLTAEGVNVWVMRTHLDSSTHDHTKPPPSTSVRPANQTNAEGWLLVLSYRSVRKPSVTHVRCACHAKPTHRHSTPYNFMHR